MTKITGIKELISAPEDATSYYMVAETTSISTEDGQASSQDSFYVYGFSITGSNSPASANNSYKITYQYADSSKNESATGSLPLLVVPTQLSSKIAAGLQNIHIDMYDPDETNVVAVLGIPLIRKGDKGDPGKTGDSGPFTYYAGSWNDTTQYTRSGERFPIVSHNDSLWYPGKEGSNTGEEPSASSTFWHLLTADEIVFAKILMAEFGKLASAVFSGDYMYSQQGTVNQENSEDFKKFDKDDPEGENSGNFSPNFYINFLTGKIFAKIGYFAGGLITKFFNIANSDAVQQDDGSYLINSNLNIEATGNSGSGYTILLPKDKSFIGSHIYIFNNSFGPYTRAVEANWYNTNVKPQYGTIACNFEGTYDSTTTTGVSTFTFRGGILYLIGVPDEYSEYCRWAIVSDNVIYKTKLY